MLNKVDGPEVCEEGDSQGVRVQTLHFRRTDFGFSPKIIDDIQIDIISQKLRSLGKMEGL